MDEHFLIVLFFTVFIASFVQGISGFAFGLIALMVFPYFYLTQKPLH